MNYSTKVRIKRAAGENFEDLWYSRSENSTIILFFLHFSKFMSYTYVFLFMSYTYLFGKFMSYTYFFDIFMSYTYGFWVIYVLYLSRATPLYCLGIHFNR